MSGALVDPQAWKKAQDAVDKVFKKFEEDKKDFVWKRFTDTYEARGTIVQEQPADRWLLYKGLFYIVEIKSCYQDRFPLKDVRPAQFAGARRVTAAGGVSVFLLRHEVTKTWYKVPGMEMWQYKHDGHSSLPRWEGLHAIDLCMEDIL